MLNSVVSGARTDSSGPCQNSIGVDRRRPGGGQANMVLGQDHLCGDRCAVLVRLAFA